MFNYMDEITKGLNFVNSKSIREVIYVSLRKSIINGIIPSGERIIEKELAARFSISRTPLRAALKRLEMENLIEYMPNSGVVVKGISFEDIVEVYKIRQTLEVLASVGAMKNITETEIKQISELLDLAEQKDEEGATKEVVGAFGEFHFKIYEISKMQRLIGMINNLNEYLQKFRDTAAYNNRRRKEALKEHRDILKAIEKNNKEDVSKLVSNHIEHSLDALVSELNNKM